MPRIRRRSVGRRSRGVRTGRASFADLARAGAASGRTLRGLLQGHAREGRAGGSAGAGASPDHPGRTLNRARCRLRASRQGIVRRSRALRLHRDHDHAYSRGCRTHGRPHRRHCRRAACRGGHADRTAPAERAQRHQPRRPVHYPGQSRGRRRMSSPTALTWFARHEILLAWREWLSMMTGGRRGRRRRAVMGLIVFAAIMHLPAYAVVGRFADLKAPLDKSTLIIMTATILLAWALMLSQAIESVTRVFYARADLDLIMSSPVRLTEVFSVRIASIALTVITMALLLSTPFVDVLVIGGGIRWFAAYGIIVALGLSAAAGWIAVTILFFRLIGPSRTPPGGRILPPIIGPGF